MCNKLATAHKIKTQFTFLEEWGLKLVREDTSNYGAYLEYVGNGVKVSFGFDYRDYYFYFYILKGENREYSDDEYGKNIGSVNDLVLLYEPNFDLSKLQPDYEIGYEKALELNAKILKKYGGEILKGEEWF